MKSFDVTVGLSIARLSSTAHTHPNMQATRRMHHVTLSFRALAKTLLRPTRTTNTVSPVGRTNVESHSQYEW